MVPSRIQIKCRNGLGNRKVLGWLLWVEQLFTANSKTLLKFASKFDTFGDLSNLL